MSHARLGAHPKRFGLAVAMLATLAGHAWAGTTASQEEAPSTWNVGDRKQLFIDHRFIATQRGVCLTVNPPEKRQIVLRPDETEDGHQFLILSVLALPFWPAIWPATLALLVLAVALNRDFAAFLYRNGGMTFAARALLYHQFYYVYSAAAFVWCLFEYHVLGIRNRLHVP